jgi:hypothetical protein
MAYTFEAMVGKLDLDVSGWDRGFSKAHGDLGKFSPEVAKNFAKAAETANLSIGEISEAAQNLADVLGTDLRAASTMLADALQNPVKGVAALGDAYLKFSAAQQDEIGELIRTGREFDAHDLILNRISDSYQRLHSNLDDLDFSGWDVAGADAARNIELEEAVEHTRELAAIEAETARNYEYEAHLLDELNAKWEEQADLKRRAATYADLPSGGTRSFLDTTQSEAARAGSSVPGSGMVRQLAGKLPGGMGGAVAGGAVAAVGYIGTQALAEFAAAESAAVRLESVLRATGYASGFSAEQLQEMSAELQQHTTFTGSAIAESQIFLATLKDIKGDTYREVLTVAGDLAVVLGTDLPGATEALARAMIDPENGMGRLQKAGIILSETQKEQIKSFMELNDVASAQRVILDEVASRTGGAAVDSAKTLSGMWEKLKNDAGNLAESIGSVLAPVVKFFIQSMNGFVLVFQKAADGIGWVVDRVIGFRDTLLEVRAAYNDLMGDVEEAEALRARMTQPDGSPVPAGAPASPGTPRRPAGGGSGGGSSTSGGGGSGSGPRTTTTTSSDPVDPFAGLAERKARDARDTSFGKHVLAEASPEQGRHFVNSLNREISTAASNGGLKWNIRGDKVDTKGFEDILSIYKSKLELMPGYSKPVWDKMEQDVLQNLRFATASQGEMREFYLRAVDDALAGGEKMFADHKKKLAEAAKVQAAAHETVNVKQGLTPSGKVDKSKAGGADKADPFEYLKTAGKNDINGKMAEMLMEANRSKGFMGFGTPEQKKALADIQGQWMLAMAAVRDSSGAARDANIEQVKAIEEAWNKLQEGIRTGSDKTAKQLVGDAAKIGGSQTKAMREAGNTTMSELGGMSRQLSGMMTGAFRGANLFGGGGLAAQFQAATSPLQKLHMELKSTGVTLAQMTLNLNAFGTGARLVDGLRNRMMELNQQIYKENERLATERVKNEENRNTRYQEREKQKAEAAKVERRESNLDLLQTITVGNKSPVMVNVNGVNDVATLFDNIEREAKRRGIDVSGRNGGR